MEFFVTKSYENWTRVGEPFEKSGKLYTKVKTPCWKCGGSGIYQGWVVGPCFRCGGAGYEYDEVRLYTAKERAQLDRAKERRAEKKEEERKAYLLVAKEKWLEKNGFNTDEVTYLALGNTYDIKEELKLAGFRYNRLLGWHNNEPGEFECAEVTFETLYDWNAENGVAYEKQGAAAVVKSIKEPASAEENKVTAFYNASVGERVRNIPATLEEKRTVNGAYGLSTMYAFSGPDNAWFVWWTTSTKVSGFQVGEKVSLTGTIKNFNEYKGCNQTVLTRCKVESI